MNAFEDLILRWVCLFDEFKDFKQSNIEHLVSSGSFKEFVNNVFCVKCSAPFMSDDEKFYNTIKTNYPEFEVEKFEEVYNGGNAVYTCIVVLLHALLKCTNNTYRDQLSQKMDDKEQVLLAALLESTQTSLFSKQNISEAIMILNDTKHPSSNVSETFSNVTPIRSKSNRSYLQTFCESPKSQSLIYQEKEKLIAKLTEDIKNECEENERLAENVKILQDVNLKLSCKLEDKEKIIKFLKDEIEELSQPKSFSDIKVDHSLAIKKLNQDILDLEFNNNELKQQLVELENQHKILNVKLEKKTSCYESLLMTCDNIESENMLLKESINVFKTSLQEKETEITSLKDELFNKSISKNLLNSSGQGTNVGSTNTLFDELSCIKLEEATHDKEKYRHKYKSIKKNLLNTENHVKDLDEQISNLKQQLQNSEMNKDKIINKFSEKKKELLECQKKINNLETKIKHLKDSVKDKENSYESVCVKLDKKENQIKELLAEIDSVKKAKTMIELILSKTNTEIETLHEENEKSVNSLLSTIEDCKNSEALTLKNFTEIQNEMKQLNDNLESKESIITFYENKAAEYYQTIGIQEEQLKSFYQETLALQSNLKGMKTKIETQEKLFNSKIRDMENTLEYHLDELKDHKNTVAKLEEILSCKQNEIDQQNELINFQKNVTETLQSDKCNQEVNIKNLNTILEQKCAENNDLKEKHQKSTLSLNLLNEQLNAVLNEKKLLEENIKTNQLQIKTTNKQFMGQINDMNSLLKSQCDLIDQYKFDIEKLKGTLEEKQNDFNEQIIVRNKQIEALSQLQLVKCKLEEKLKSNDQTLFNKENELKLLKDKLQQSSLNIANLTEKIDLVVSENNFLTKNLNVISSTMIDMQEDFNEQLLNMKTNLESYDNKVCIQTENILKLKNYLLAKLNELNIQIDVNNKQKDNIVSLEIEKLDLLKKTEVLDQCLLSKNATIINLEKELQNNNLIVCDLKEKLGILRIEKVMIETNLNETSEQFKISQEQFNDQINKMFVKLSDHKEETMKLKDQYLEMENMLEIKQKEIEEQVELTVNQNKIIDQLKCEKEILEKQVLNANEHFVSTQAEIKSLHTKLEDFQYNTIKLEKNLETVSKEKISLEIKLKDAINEKEILSQQFDEQIKEVKNCLRDTSHENNDLKKHVRDLKNNLNIKHLQIEHATEENKQFKKIIDFTENQCIDLQDKLKVSKDSILQKEKSIDILKAQHSEISTLNENLEKQVVQVKEDLNQIHIDLENKIQQSNEQEKIIVKFNNEKELINDQVKKLENSLSHKEYEFNLCEGKLYDCSIIINDLDKKLANIKNEKLSSELQLNETITYLTDKSNNLILQLESKENNISDIQKKLIHEQNMFQKQQEQSNKQTKAISCLKAEKDKFLEEINQLQVCLNENEHALKSLQEQNNDYKVKNEEFQILNLNLISELDTNKIKLTNIHQELKKQLTNMETKCVEVENQLNKKNIELDEYVNKYNCQTETIGILTTERDNLIEESNSLKSTISDKDCIIATNKEKLHDYVEQNGIINNEKAALEVKVNQTNKELDITRQNFTQQLEEMKKQFHDVQEELNSKHLDLELQQKYAEEQTAIISILTSEKTDLINDTNKLKDHLSEKENALMLNHVKLNNCETLIEELQALNDVLKSEMNDTKAQLDHTRYDLTQKLETSNKQLNEVQKKLDKLQIVLDNQIKCSNDQLELNNTLMLEKGILVDETSRFKEYLTQNEKKLQNFEKLNKEIECKKAALVLELNQLKCQLNNLRQESTKTIFEMNTKFNEAQESLKLTQSDINKHIELKKNTLADIYLQINDLKTTKNELELLIKKERTDFETQFGTYSINCINNKSLLGHHEDSLMEVITSADTFMEKNGIQVAQVENPDDYSIIERLKQLFEVLKMFIININTQGNERVVTQANTECVSNEAFNELLVTSNKQLEKIKNLESEMTRLKSECNHKMSKVQQKTQEYVTSEYEKKFERKREQMKQFCKDLETKMHQDYEAKLMKYKEKISKDEIHIKELGQQLWDVSEKYLQLQHRNRRESTMSLPYEMPSSSQTANNFPKYNSFTLPNSSSTGQIRSLIEENTRSYQDHYKRNVPVGIGKKFSLSSGKIFPKEEDEEGEMFNHSCLADLKQGKVNLSDGSGKQYIERLSELQARNLLCPPHLRSCYAVETNLLPNNSLLTEEDIKTSVNYSDCESENLIPNDRNKKKDRNQTSYKKPGPPTPSKNGGRQSLSGNQKVALKESKEANTTNKRRTSSTPNKLFSLFMSKK